MPHLYLLSWYHHGTEADARNFFQKLREGCQKGIPFPFDCPYQVGLVHCTARGEEHWCVGVLVIGDVANDDRIEQNARLEQWFTRCGADFSIADKRSEPMLHPSVGGTLQRIYGSHYKCVETFGTLG
jgi:hypothetical protein